jgi:serine/threonine protein kinase
MQNHHPKETTTSYVRNRIALIAPQHEDYPPQKVAQIVDKIQLIHTAHKDQAKFRDYKKEELGTPHDIFYRDIGGKGTHRELFAVIRSALGSGRFGTVILLENLNSPKEYYALKICEKESDDTTEWDALQAAGDAFYREYSDGYEKILMKFYPGKDLADYLAEAAEVSEDKTPWLDIMTEMMKATNNFHKAKILHRDIRPGNFRIEIDSRGKINIFLIDLGSAHICSSAKMKYRTTDDVHTTLEIAAPETVNSGVRLFSRPSDIYSLGASFAYMLDLEDQKQGKASRLLRGLRTIDKFDSSQNIEDELVREHVLKMVKLMLQAKPEKRPENLDPCIAYFEMIKALAQKNKELKLLNATDASKKMYAAEIIVKQNLIKIHVKKMDELFEKIAHPAKVQAEKKEDKATVVVAKLA